VDDHQSTYLTKLKIKNLEKKKKKKKNTKQRFGSFPNFQKAGTGGYYSANQITALNGV
jgi:hypothetical protein